MDNTKTINVLSICTGYGGFELALQQIWPESNFRVVAVEIEAYAAANLVAKAEEGKLAIEAVYSNVKTFPADVFRGCFDIVVAGYPCQPFSNAGQRRGKADPRHLWPFIHDILRKVRPVWCLFENVRGHTREGLFDVLRDLHRLGYTSECGIFSAAEVGASHKRERLFIMAYAESVRQRGRANAGSNEKWQVCESGQKRNGVWGETEGQCTMANTCEQRLQGGELGASVAGEGKAASGAASECCKAMGHALCDNGREVQTQARQSGKRQEPLFTSNKWPAKPGQEQESWEQPRTIESSLGRTADGFANWVDRIRLCGNGIVPQQAVKAIRCLSGKLLQENIETQESMIS